MRIIVDGPERRRQRIADWCDYYLDKLVLHNGEFVVYDTLTTQGNYSLDPDIIRELKLCMINVHIFKCAVYRYGCWDDCEIYVLTDHNVVRKSDETYLNRKLFDHRMKGEIYFRN